MKKILVISAFVLSGLFVFFNHANSNNHIHTVRAATCPACDSWLSTCFVCYSNLKCGSCNKCWGCGKTGW